MSEIGYAEVQALETILRFLSVTPNVGDRTTLNIDVAGILRQQGLDPNAVLAGLGLPGGGGGGVPGAPTVPATNATVPPIEQNTTVPVVVAGPNGTAGVGNATVGALLSGLASAFGVNLTENATLALINAANAATSGVNGTGPVDLNTLLSGLAVPTAAGLAEQLLSPTIGLTVADGVDDPYGLWPSTLGNMVVLDQRYMSRVLLDQLCYETLRQPFGDTATTGGGGGGLAGFTVPGVPTQAEIEQQFKIEEFALIIVAMMRDRYNIYYAETLERTQKVTHFSNDLFRALGLGFGGEAQYPIALALVAFDFFSLFLNSLFSSVVAVVLVMGFLLVYTLLLTNTEERSFEVAMLRAQGMNRVQLLLLLASQSTAFIVPGIAVAIALLLSVNAILEVVLSTVTLAPAETSRISVVAVVFPIVMGLVIPLVANYRPAMSVMTSSLRDALSMYRQTSSETTVTIMKLAELGLAPWQTLVGWLLVIGGFVVYYLVPLSFIFNNLTMFFILLNMILLGMLLGLCLICFTVQERLENAVLWLLLWGKEQRLGMLIRKNFAAHADRNGKAFLMFTITSATLIFGGALFALLAVSISDTVKVVNGADVNVQSLTETAPLNKTNIDELLLGEKQQRGTVLSWSYATYVLNDFPQISPNPISELSTVIGFPKRSLQVQGIDANFLDTVFREFVILNQKDEAVDYGITTPLGGGATAASTNDTSSASSSSSGSEWSYNAEAVANRSESSGAFRPDFVRSMYTTPPTTLYQPVGDIYTGFPPNRSRPNIFSKYSTVLPVVLASSAESVLGLRAGSAATVTFDYRIGIDDPKRWSTVFLCSSRALVDKLSGFPTMTNLQITFRGTLVLTTFDGMRSLLRANEFDFGKGPATTDAELRYPSGAIIEPTFGRLWIRLNPALTPEERSDFANRLRLVLNPYFHLVIDTAVVVDSVQTAADLITYFFYFVAVIAIILDTFMLWLTFISNIQLNSWSVGVLRSLGFTEAQVTRSYVYEALTLVLASFFAGTIIGLLVATTVTLQMTLLLSLPFQMLFPIELFFFLLVLSVFSAFAASMIPARSINAKPISLILKSG